MAVILEFPVDRGGWARIEAKIRAALESHDPAMRGAKFEAVMDVLRRYDKSGPTSITFCVPKDQPFTESQRDCIQTAIEGFAGEIQQVILAAAKEIILAKIAIIDLEAGAGATIK